VITFPLFETRTPEPTSRPIVCWIPAGTEETLWRATTTVTEPFTCLKRSAILLDSDDLQKHDTRRNTARIMNRIFIVFIAYPSLSDVANTVNSSFDVSV
jgi:hypothetical protein